MAKRTGQEIKDDLLRYLQFVQEGLDRKVAVRIGDAVIEAMLDLISKGISPIQGRGRFPAYKWAAFRNQLKKERSAVNKALRKNEQALFKLRRMNQRQMLVAQKEANRRDIGSVSGKYPYNEIARKYGKKARPVNLFLTGDFLRALQARVTGTAGEFGLEVGFFEGSKDRFGTEAYLKEQGHREGANGQPERPTIPLGTEDFAVSIQDAIWRIIEEEIDRQAAKGSS